MSFVARLIKLMVILFVLCAAAYFMMFNVGRIDVSFGHLGGIELPAAVAYIVSFFFGASVVAVFFGYEYTRQSITMMQLRRRIKRLESERRDSDDVSSRPSHHSHQAVSEA